MASKYSLYIYPLAAKDMECIFDYIANELQNPDAAVSQMENFEKLFDTVCFAPLSCPLINNEFVKDSSLRKLIVNNYIAFYRPNAERERIEIVRVLYGMMDFKNLL